VTGFTPAGIMTGVDPDPSASRLTFDLVSIPVRTFLVKLHVSRDLFSDADAVWGQIATQFGADLGATLDQQCLVGSEPGIPVGWGAILEAGSGVPRLPLGPAIDPNSIALWRSARASLRAQYADNAIAIMTPATQAAFENLTPPVGTPPIRVRQ